MEDDGAENDDEEKKKDDLNQDKAELAKVEDNIKQYQSKTSYILDLGDDSEGIYNIALESVLI